MVTNELRGEKVDIVPFSDEPREFVMRALQPAKVKEVHLDDLTGTATVVVHDFQLSLAIGKEGQNARLAARLTGWRIDIKSETQIAEEEAYANQEWAEGEWVENEAGEMVWQPAEGGEAVSAEQWSLGEAARGDRRTAPADGAGVGEAWLAEDAEAAADAGAGAAGDGVVRGGAVTGEPPSGEGEPWPGRRKPRPGRSRTCVGCRTRAPAGNLVRVARRADGSLVVDRDAPGRGAWLCQEPATGEVNDQLPCRRRPVGTPFHRAFKQR